MREVEFAGSRANHPLDEIDASDFFSDAMFNLQARVDLEEVKRAGGVVVNVFDGTGVVISGGVAQAGGGFEQTSALLGGESGGGRFLDDFLIAALNGAVAFADGYYVAAAVAEDLDFDVAGVLDKFFEKDSAFLEIVFCEAFHSGEGF